MDIGFDTIEFAQQDGFGVHGVAGVDKVFSGANCQVVHHFQTAGNDAGGNDVTYRSPSFLDGVERRQQYLGRLRFGQQFDGDFGDHPEHAFGAGEQCQQVEAG
ncbi:hypothetical protein D3C76_1639540 [compost metagenome]